MGMAASQARYLALTARKTNTEWEGQQINQARTALSNQSAGLFNRLLNMEVPNAPKSTDYTKLQYSYSDGDNESVFENWHQINVADPNYNYVVSHYYMADVFTGIKRLLENPQVQISDVLKKVEYNSKTTDVTKIKDGSINVNYKINGYGYDQGYDKITAEQVESDETLKTALTNFEKSAGLLHTDGSITTSGVYGYKDDNNTWHFFVAYDYNKIHEGDVETETKSNLKKSFEIYESDNELFTSDPEYTFDGIYKTQDADGNWSFININDYKQLNKDNVESIGHEAVRDALYQYEKDNGLLNEYTTLRYNNVYGKQDAEGNWSFVNTVNYKPVTRSDINSSPELKTALYNYEKENNLIKLTYDTVYGKVDIDNNWDFVNITGYDTITEAIVEAPGAENLKLALTNYETENNLLNPDGTLSYDNIYYVKKSDGSWDFKHTVGYTQLTENVVSSDTGTLKNSLTDYEYNNNMAELSLENVYIHQKEDGTWEFKNTVGYNAVKESDVESSEALKTALTNYETDENILVQHADLTYDNIYGKQNADGTWSFEQLNNYTKVRKSDIDTAEQDKLANALKKYEIENGIIDEGDDLSFNNIYGKQDEDGNWNIIDTNGYHALTETEVESSEALKTALTNYESEHGLLNEDGSLNYDQIYGEVDSEGKWNFVSTKGYDSITAEDVDKSAQMAIKKAFTNYEIKNDLLKSDPGLKFDNIYATKNADGSYAFVNTENYKTLSQEVIDEPGNEQLKEALIKYETENDLLDDKGNLVFNGIYGYQNADNEWNFINTNDTNKYTKMTQAVIDTTSNQSLEEALRKYETQHNLLNPDGSLSYDGIYGYRDDDEIWHFIVNKQSEKEQIIQPKDYIDYSTVNGPSFVGNSKLTELNQLIEDKETGINQVTDLAQILRDCPDSSINKYVSFDPQGNLQYEGSGIYTFEMQGKTYYTTKSDLIESAENAQKLNKIDDQVKLTYYSAGYVPTKIEATNQAMIETGDNGRFKSVKFDNDSIVYNLNVEEVTDEAAYESAMNDYLYKKAQYEKTIADINAKTSMIQQEDRTLELRLKQLDTEQNALATEMDAVKKVIKDNVEKTFKTFSD